MVQAAVRRSEGLGEPDLWLPMELDLELGSHPEGLLRSCEGLLAAVVRIEVGEDLNMGYLPAVHTEVEQHKEKADRILAVLTAAGGHHFYSNRYEVLGYGAVGGKNYFGQSSFSFV